MAQLKLVQSRSLAPPYVGSRDGEASSVAHNELRWREEEEVIKLINEEGTSCIGVMDEIWRGCLRSILFVGLLAMEQNAELLVWRQRVSLASPSSSFYSSPSRPGVSRLQALGSALPTRCTIVKPDETVATASPVGSSSLGPIQAQDELLHLTISRILSAPLPWPARNRTHRSVDGSRQSLPTNTHHPWSTELRCRR